MRANADVGEGEFVVFGSEVGDLGFEEGDFSPELAEGFGGGEGGGEGGGGGGGGGVRGGGGHFFLFIYSLRVVCSRADETRTTLSLNFK